MEELHVVVVSDDPLARTGIALLLAGSEGLTVLHQVGVDEDWFEPAAEAGGGEGPDAAVWDLGLGDRSGLDALRALPASAPPVVAIVADALDAREALAAGARVALPRNVDGERLAAALRAAVQGLVVLDDSFAAAVLGGVSGVRDAPPAAQDLPESLTPREAEVLQLLSQGLANKSIAQRLGISDHTVKFHVNAILGKLGVQSRGEAIVQAVRLGLVAL
jgi:two-component system, NarL family, nitrate/nitrite response regulator NarL